MPVTMDEMLVPDAHRRARRAPADRRRRHAVRLVPGLRRGRGAQRDPLRQGGRRRRRQARGSRRRWPRDVRAIVEAGIAVGRPHRPDAAVRDDARRLQDAGQDRGRGRAQLVDDAEALQAAGASLLVLEAVPAPVADEITRRLEIPTIGIGAGAGCDGQVLVYHDLLGLSEGHLPRFVKRYANLSREIRDALEAYAARGAGRVVPRARAHLRDGRGGAERRSPTRPACAERRSSSDVPSDVRPRRSPAPRRAAARRRGTP